MMQRRLDLGYLKEIPFMHTCSFQMELLSGKVVYFDGKIANLVWRKIEQRILPVEKK